MGGLFQLFWVKGRDFQDLGQHPLLGLYKECLGTVMAALGVSFHLLIQDQGQVLSYLILISLCCVLGQCQSFKSCALPLSLLLQACPATGEWPGGLGRRLRRETLACVHFSVCSCASGPSGKKAHLHHSQNEYLS